MIRYRDLVRSFYWQAEGRALPLGLGCAYLGQPGDADAQRGFRQTLDDAYAAGLRYFDTAEMYGGSEFRVGEFLARIPRESVFIATKSRIDPAFTPQETGKHLLQNLMRSLERLNTDHVDAFLIHDIPHLAQVLGPGGGFEALQQARAEGLLRFIGLGTRYLDLHEEAGAAGFDLTLTYLDYTLIEQSAAPVIASLAARGVGVVNGTPLANGLLVGTDPRTHTETHPEVRRHRHRAVRLYDFASARGLPLMALALQFSLRNPDLSLTLTGPSDPAQLRSTLSALRFPIAPPVWDELPA